MFERNEEKKQKIETILPKKGQNVNKINEINPNMKLLDRFRWM